MSGGSTPKNNKVGSLVSQSSYALRASPSRYRPKKKKVTQLTLSKRGQFKIWDADGVDRTPKLLYDPEYQVIDEWQPTVLDYVDTDIGSMASQISLPRAFQQGSSLAYGSRQQHSVSLQMSFTNIANVDSYKEPTKVLEGDIVSYRSEERISEAAPSAFRLRECPSREFYPPHSKVPLVAEETDSFTLFSLESVLISADDEQAEALKEKNEIYEYMTTGKGRYKRKLNTSEQQTSAYIRISQASYCPKVPTKNSSTWVTSWKLYDEYQKSSDERRDYLTLPSEDQWQQLTEDSHFCQRFLSQSLILERILGDPTYRKIQITYKICPGLDPLALDIQFLYSAKTLWLYETDFVQKRCVTSIVINTLNPNIIAVGHGKFFYNETDSGYICIWCVKNPKHPERCYKFRSSVKTMDFALWTPNLLAAGFGNGDLLILDISSFEKKILYQKNSVKTNTYDTILFVSWWIFADIYGKKEERIMATAADGRIIQFRRRGDNLVPFQMMRITRTEGKIRGIECLRGQETEEITMVRFPSARCVVRYPNDNQFYLVTGDDGAIHKCSMNFFTQHTEAFQAHTGPVYALKFSPFCTNIFFTCGADGALRLWAWDIFEPLITLTVGPDAVEDADWSPRNSTIIASISECYLYLWDLRRKTYHPASTITHPAKLKFCKVQFSQNGETVLLGDIEGVVHLMALQEMPFEEKFKQDILAACIEKELVVKPKLLKLLKKSGPPFSSEK